MPALCLGSSLFFFYSSVWKRMHVCVSACCRETVLPRPQKPHKHNTNRIMSCIRGECQIWSPVICIPFDFSVCSVLHKPCLHFIPLMFGLFANEQMLQQTLTADIIPLLLCICANKTKCVRASVKWVYLCMYLFVCWWECVAGRHASL